MLKELDTLDWANVFGWAGEENGAKNTIGRRKAAVLPPAIRAPGESEVVVTREDVAQVAYLREGEAGVREWVGCFKLKDGRWLFVAAACQHGGWEKGGGTGGASVAPTARDLVEHAMSEEGRSAVLGGVAGKAEWVELEDPLLDFVEATERQREADEKRREAVEVPGSDLPGKVWHRHSDDYFVSDDMVLRSAAGWYIGRRGWDAEGGFGEPFDRKSGYYETEAEAQTHLKYGQYHGPDLEAELRPRKVSPEESEERSRQWDAIVARHQSINTCPMCGRNALDQCGCPACATNEERADGKLERWMQRQDVMDAVNKARDPLDVGALGLALMNARAFAEMSGGEDQGLNALLGPPMQPRAEKVQQWREAAALGEAVFVPATKAGEEVVVQGGPKPLRFAAWGPVPGERIFQARASDVRAYLVELERRAKGQPDLVEVAKAIRAMRPDLEQKPDPFGVRVFPKKQKAADVEAKAKSRRSTAPGSAKAKAKKERQAKEKKERPQKASEALGRFIEGARGADAGEAAKKASEKGDKAKEAVRKFREKGQRGRGDGGREK